MKSIAPPGLDFDLKIKVSNAAVLPSSNFCFQQQAIEVIAPDELIDAVHQLVAVAIDQRAIL